MEQFIFIALFAAVIGFWILVFKLITNFDSITDKNPSVMKALKYIGQVVASIIYTFIITWVLQWLLSLLFMWMITLSTGWMIALVILGISALFGVVMLISNLGVVPYFWTNKENIVSVIVSVVITVSTFGYFLISTWSYPHDNGFVTIVTLLFFTVVFISLAYTFVTGQIAAYRGIDNEK